MTKDAIEMPLNVAVRGDTLVIHLPGGADVTMSVPAAERSVERLMDALALAKGHHPSAARR